MKKSMVTLFAFSALMMGTNTYSAFPLSEYPSTRNTDKDIIRMLQEQLLSAQQKISWLETEKVALMELRRSHSNERALAMIELIRAQSELAAAQDEIARLKTLVSK